MSANAPENTEATPAAAPAAPTAVENVFEAPANTSIAPTDTETSAADAAHAASAAEGRRLYIGNLAYSTTDDQLKEFFTGFDIESTSIPTNPRSGRAVGYAFVDLKTKEEAERAIEELSGKEVSERKVSVQLARKPGTGSSRKENYNNNPVATEGQLQQEDGEQSQQQGGARRNYGRRSGRGRGRGGRSRGGNRANGTSATAENTGEEETTPVVNVLPLTEPANASEAAPNTEASGTAPTGTPAEGDGNASGFKGRKKRGPPENGVPSTTKVMVANLPYELSEEKLLELFAAYQPESAKIALRPIPRFMVRKLLQRGEPRKGRGFGFVTLASEEMQKKAVEEMNGQVIDNREIAVKVAIDNPKIEGEAEEAGEGGKSKEEGAEEPKKDEAKENGVQVERREAMPVAVAASD